jgi:hypothetical protein
LGFAIWKDQHIYLCRPISFEVPRSATSPLEYPYTIQLQAFGRISPKALQLDLDSSREQSGKDPNTVFQVLNRLQNARSTLNAAAEVVKAVRGDIQGVTEIVRECILVCKDMLGVASTVLDLPAALATDLRDSIIRQWKDVLRDSIRLRIQASNLFDSSSQSSLAADWQLLEDAASESATKGILGMPPSHPASLIFDNVALHSEILGLIEPGQLFLSEAVQAKIDREMDRIRKLARFDFEQRRDAFVQAAADYAEKVGAGHATFNITYSRPPPSAARSTPSDYDFEVMNAFIEASVQFAKLAARREISATQTVTSMEYVAGLARQSGIAFKVPRSKFTVPFPYGYSLEELSKLYLSTPDRWHEIATLNNLHSPYVDEEGFVLPLLVNARNNTIVVSDATNLYQGQVVWIQSNNVPRQKRRVVRIDKLASNLNNVALDGAALDLYTTGAGAFIHAFLPYTLNSQMLVFIPSDEPSAEDPRTKDLSAVNDYDHLLFIGGIDWLLTQNGDLVLTPDGDGRYSFGLTNMVQQARIVLGTPRGSLLHHPNFGLSIKPGSSTADLNAQELALAAREAFSQDRSYSGVLGASVFKNGPVAQMILSLGIAGSNRNVPIAVDVERQ